MSVNALSIITAALRKLGVEAQGETVSAENSTFMLGELNRMVDSWCAQGRLIYSVGFSTYVIIASHQPHTIGPVGADWTCTVGRPVEILKPATLVLTSSTPNIEIDLELLDDQGWGNVGIKTLTSSLPTKLYYSPDFPNGSVYLWPVPTTVNSVRLQTRNLISSFADLTTDYDLPFGYENALVCSLAETAMIAYPQPELQAVLVQQARDARAVISSVNTKSPNLSTVIGGRDTSWHFLTGGYRP
jgi:hypothetical protein